MPPVRLATPEDEDALVESLARVADQWGLRQGSGMSYPFNAPKARETVQKAIRQDQSWVAVIGDGGRIEGSICIFVAEPFFSDAPYLAELWTVVMPDYRGSDHAKRLVAFAKSLADTAELPLVIGVVARDRVEAKRRLFDVAVGQYPSGNFYCYQPKSGAREMAA